MLKKPFAFLTLLVMTLLFAPHTAADTVAQLDNADGLLSNTIHSLCPYQKGMLIGTSRGLNVWDGQNLTSLTSFHGLPQRRIMTLATDGEMIAVGSWGDGLSIWDGEAWVHHNSQKVPGLGNMITGTAFSNDVLWISTYGHGIARFSQGEWSIYNRGDSGLESSFIQALYLDKDSDVWVGTSQGTVQKLEADSWITVASLAPPTPITVLLADTESLWIGTDKGLSQLSYASGNITRVNTDKTLSIQALTDHKDELVVGTLSGLFQVENNELIELTSTTHTPVGALASDTHNTLWVGSLSEGLDIIGESTLPNPARRPALLIHGWRGPDSDLLQDSEFWFFADWLKHDGVTPFYVAGVSPEKTLFENARVIEQAINLALTEKSADQVDIIAFSMGGLNTRAALSLLDDPGLVHQVITLGSPHQGATLWFPFLLWEYLHWTNEPSALELFPEYMAVLNETLPTRGIPITAIAGDARNTKDLPTLFAQLPASDGLVSSWSALGPESLASARIVTRDIHAWGRDTILLDLPTLLLPENTYLSIIRPLLFDQESTLTNKPTETVEQYERPAPLARGPFNEASVRPSETITLSLELDQAARTNLLVRSKGSLPEVTLIDPSGTLIDPDGADERDDIEYLGFDQADLRAFTITDTVPGLWSVVIEGDPNAAEPTEIVAYAENTSNMRLNLQSDKCWYQPGESAVITATLLNSSSSLETITAIAYGPDKKPTTIPMIVDGNSATGVLSLDSPGYYAVLITARSSNKEQDIEREDSLVVGVMSPVTLLEEPTFRETSDGMLLSLNISIPDDGEYLFTVDRGAESLSQKLALSKGENNVLIPLPYHASAEAACPYQIKILDLNQVSLPALVYEIKG